MNAAQEAVYLKLQEEAGPQHSLHEHRVLCMTRVWCICGWEQEIRIKNAMVRAGKAYQAKRHHLGWVVDHKKWLAQNGQNEEKKS